MKFVRSIGGKICVDCCLRPERYALVLQDGSTLGGLCYECALEAWTSERPVPDKNHHGERA